MGQLAKTQMIAGMYSFLKAGSGSKQSNHMYKLDPIHQGIIERGSKVRSQLAPTMAEGSGEWVDMAGLIMPKDELDGLIDSLQQIDLFLHMMNYVYYNMEWTWAYQKIEEYYGVKLSEITADQIIELVEIWKSSVIGLDKLLYKDTQKEFSLTSMTGFGVDSTLKEKEEDFETVRGAFEQNPFVTAVKERIITKRALGNELIERIRHHSLR